MAWRAGAKRGVRARSHPLPRPQPREAMGGEALDCARPAGSGPGGDGFSGDRDAIAARGDSHPQWSVSGLLRRMEAGGLHARGGGGSAAQEHRDGGEAGRAVEACAGRERRRAERAVCLARGRCSCRRGGGFGPPVLEAFAHGVPVVASDIPALREASGGLATLVPVADVEAWRLAVRQVWDAPGDAVARRVWAAQFTWERSARALRGVLEELS